MAVFFWPAALGKASKPWFAVCSRFFQPYISFVAKFSVFPPNIGLPIFIGVGPPKRMLPSGYLT